ncbi:4-hydroxy-tetrahydrodipicolinate reductase [bacterium]
MIKIVVAGSNGRMGKRIIALLSEEIDCKLIGGLDIDTDEKTANELIKSCDVVIDFSSPEATITLLDKCKEHKKAIVIGTTGFDENQKETIKDYANEIPCVFSPNMSVGVNVFFALLKKAASFLKEYDTEIVETHHNKKKDSPSGTALKLADIIVEANDGNKKLIYGRKGNVGERKSDELCIHAVRMGDVVGEHSVFFAANNERIEITHKAHSRDNFAKGSIVAAKWIANKPNGAYDMFDVLNIER